ncbi:MAG: MFS transporter [Acidobacteria bacterium]|nr:MFS transporter [Acidobacteriota bacterium]
MNSEIKQSSARSIATLHGVFALTGVLHVVGGALLPSLASRFHLSDANSGLLFLLYFAGTSVGALLCRRNYARTMSVGFVGMAVACVAVAFSPRAVLEPLFFLLGIGVGVPMSAVTLFTGRTFPDRCAPLLTILNFSWSIGALAAPLIAARVLAHHDYRTAYKLFAAAAACAAVACAGVLRDGSEPVPLVETRDSDKALLLVLTFAFAAFLQVGIENTVATWLPTYALRTEERGLVLAAATSSFYWAGFLSSRGLSSLLLLRVKPMQILWVVLASGLFSALMLQFAPNVALRNLAMFLMGVSLAPTYPLVLSGFFARSQQTANSRWILFTAGFGGSVLPWIAGFVSSHTASIRTGMLVIPAGLLSMSLLVPAIGIGQKPHSRAK